METLTLSRKIESWVFSIFAISMVVFAFAPPVIYWNKCELFALDAGPCIAQFVDRFQTLITGLAAVIGAFFTVRAMHLTDQESDRRHNQLMGLSLRADALKIDRFFKDRYPKLIQNISKVRDYRRIQVPDFETEECRKEFAAAMNDCFRAVGSIKMTCDPKVIGGIEPYLSGEVTQLMAKVSTDGSFLSDAIGSALSGASDVISIRKEIKDFRDGNLIANNVPEKIHILTVQADHHIQQMKGQMSDCIGLVDNYVSAADNLSNALFALHSRYVPYMD